MRRLAGRGGRHGRYSLPAGPTGSVIPDPPGGGGCDAVVSVSPAYGSTAGGTAVTITVENAVGDLSNAVYFGASLATGVTVVSPTSITCDTPTGSGSVTVSVADKSLADGFGYVASDWRTVTHTRPTPAQNNPVTKYANLAASGTGHAGTEGDPYSLADIQTQVQAGNAHGWTINCKGDGGNDGFYFSSGGGISTDWLILQQWAGQTQANLNGGDDEYPAVWVTGRSYIVIDGFTLGGGNVDSNGVVKVAAGGSNVHIINSTIDAGTWAPGVLLNNASACWVIDNAILHCGDIDEGNDGDGVYICNGSTNNYIVGNTITHCGHSALTISFLNTGEGVCTGNVIANNLINNTEAGGIILNGKANGTTVECNDIWGSGTYDGANPPATESGILLQGDGNTVRYNRIWNCDGAGIELQAYTFAGFQQGAINSHVHNNTIFNVCQDAGYSGGIALTITTGAPDTYLVDNVIESNLIWGVHSTYESPSYPNKPLITVAEFSSGGNWSSGIGGNIIRNNGGGVDDTPACFAYVSKSGGTTSYTVAEFNAAGFANCADNWGLEDPLFESEVTPDLAIQTGSPAIDAGYETDGVSYLGSAPDCGAYEKA